MKKRHNVFELVARLTVLAAIVLGIFLEPDLQHDEIVDAAMMVTACAALAMIAVTSAQLKNAVDTRRIQARYKSRVPERHSSTRRMMENLGVIGPTARLRRSIAKDVMSEPTDRDVPLPMAWPTARSNPKVWKNPDINGRR